MPRKMQRQDDEIVDEVDAKLWADFPDDDDDDLDLPAVGGRPRILR